MHKTRTLGIFGALLLSIAATAQAAAPALIERSRIFGNPTRTQARLSPDGKWISWLAPRDGVLNVWVAPAGDSQKGRALTTEKQRPIRQHFWAADSTAILFLKDKGGDENFLLHAVDPASGKERLLTPFDKTRVELIGTSHRFKNRILVGLNNRDARWHDVHDLDLATGKLTHVFRNEGYAGFVADDSLTLRLALKSREDGGTDFHRVTNNVVESKPFSEAGLDDALSTSALGYTNDGRTLYWLDSRGRDKTALIAQDAASGATKVIGESAQAEVSGLLTDPRSGVVQAYSVAYLRNEWTTVDASVREDFAFLKQKLAGDITVTSRTDADDKWTVATDAASEPNAVWLYDRKAKQVQRLFVTRPELEGAPLVNMHPYEIKSRDGLTLVSYLSLPPGSDADDDGVPQSPLPLVLFVHGGPWARDEYGFDTYHQWLANRGYAVLAVNFRGSTGFGKSFTSAGNLQWGRKMHDDLLDAVEWAIDRKVTTQEKVAIMGGSYGGYATLAGMAFTPTQFACGVDIVGPSNLFTLLQTIPPYWEAGKQQFYARMGNPTTEAGKALLNERSPLFKADQIVRPLLIGQGANDPRVNVRESDQIVAAMQAKNIPVTYVLFPDEGHGFARPENNIAFNAIAESFLGRCLGGRVEPIGGAVKASTAQIKHGADYVPELKATAR